MKLAATLALGSLKKGITAFIEGRDFDQHLRQSRELFKRPATGLH